MPVLLVRHAVAVSRRAWPGDDADRPLDKRGRRQAAALVDQLAPFDVVRVLSSPADRCLETVVPAAIARGLKAEAEDDLFEGHGRQATELVRALLAVDDVDADGPAPAGAAIVLCTHGDVIPEVLQDLERDGADLGVDRRCQKGSIWVLTRGPGGVGGRYLPPPA